MSFASVSKVSNVSASMDSVPIEVMTPSLPSPGKAHPMAFSNISSNEKEG